MFVPARQAQLARTFTGANLDVIGLHKCRLPTAQCCTIGNYTCMYSAGPGGRDGGGFGIAVHLAKHRHLAVIHQDPSRLLVVVRSPVFALNATILHAPAEGTLESEVWWLETYRLSRLLPSQSTSLFLLMQMVEWALPPAPQ